jgi:hypothetical protein
MSFSPLDLLIGLCPPSQQKFGDPSFASFVEMFVHMTAVFVLNAYFWTVEPPQTSGGADFQNLLSF